MARFRCGTAFSSSSFDVLGLAQGEGLQRLQRRRRGLFQRGGEFLHRPDRLAQLLPQIGSRLVQRLQHLLFTFGLHLGPSQRISGLRVDRVQINHVMAAQGGNRARQHGFYAIPHADFPRHIAGHPLIGRPAHQAQRCLDPRLRKNVQIRRLLQLHRQRLLQRSVEDSVAGGVDEVSQQDGIFFGQRLPNAASRRKRRPQSQRVKLRREPQSSKPLSFAGVCSATSRRRPLPKRTKESKPAPLPDAHGADG